MLKDIDFLMAAEIVGYLASLFIMLSLLMTSVLKLRWYLLLGNIIYVAYGYMIQSMPILLLNAINAFINIYFIYQALHLKGSYKIIPADLNSPLLNHFVSYYVNDINRYFPNLKTFQEEDVIFLMIKGTAVIGVAAFRKIDDNEYNIIIDYVAKTHRDQKPGRLLYEESDLFSMLDTTQIKTECNNPKHEKYLKNMGFVKNGNDWIKSKSFKKQ